jgi:hypothetical protein
VDLTLLVLLFFPDLPKATWTVLTQLWESRFGRLLAAAGLLYCISGFAAFFMPHGFNLGHVVRVSGTGPINYALSLSGDFGVRDIATWPAWTSFLMWSPLPELHETY